MFSYTLLEWCHFSSRLMIPCAYLEDPISTETVQRELHKSNVQCRAAISKLQTTLKGEKGGVMITKPIGLMNGNM